MSTWLVSEFTDSIAAHRAALAERGVELDQAIASGAPEAHIRELLDEAELPITRALVEWFEFCGGLVESSGAGAVLQGRGYLSLADALALRSEDHADHSRLVPLTRDHPVVVIDVDTGHVGELDVEQGWIELGESPAAWIRSQTDALPPLGPHPHARSMLPLSATPGELGLTPASQRQFDGQAEHLAGLDIAEMWIQSAAPDSKVDNLGLEREQAEALRSLLIERGVTAAAGASIIEMSQRAQPPHNLSIWYRQTTGT